jgi:hypothetical protein
VTSSARWLVLLAFVIAALLIGLPFWFGLGGVAQLAK